MDKTLSQSRFFLMSRFKSSLQPAGKIYTRDFYRREVQENQIVSSV